MAMYLLLSVTVLSIALAASDVAACLYPCSLLQEHTTNATCDCQYQQLQHDNIFSQFIKGEEFRILYLQYNNITTLPPGTFTDEWTGRALYLSHNQIMMIEEKSFTGLDQLQHMSLDNNPISVIAPNAFRDLIHLDTLDLSHNLLTTTVFTEAKSFNLSYNLITRLTSQSFTNMSRLQALYLSSNRISAIDNNTFQGLNNLTKIDLSNNSISDLPPNAFATLPVLTYLNLIGNSFLVDRVLCSFGTKSKSVVTSKDTLINYAPCQNRTRLCYNTPTRAQKFFCECNTNEYFSGDRCVPQSNSCSIAMALSLNCTVTPSCQRHGNDYSCVCPVQNKAVCGGLPPQRQLNATSPPTIPTTTEGDSLATNTTDANIDSIPIPTTTTSTSGDSTLTTLSTVTSGRAVVLDDLTWIAVAAVGVCLLAGVSTYMTRRNFLKQKPPLLEKRSTSSCVSSGEATAESTQTELSHRHLQGQHTWESMTSLGHTTECSQEEAGAIDRGMSFDPKQELARELSRSSSTASANEDNKSMYVEAAERKRGWQATPRVLWRRQDRPASDSNLNYISEGYSEFKVSNIHKEFISREATRRMTGPIVATDGKWGQPVHLQNTRLWKRLDKPTDEEGDEAASSATVTNCDNRSRVAVKDGRIGKDCSGLASNPFALLCGKGQVSVVSLQLPETSNIQTAMMRLQEAGSCSALTSEHALMSGQTYVYDNGPELDDHNIYAADTECHQFPSRPDGKLASFSDLSLEAYELDLAAHAGNLGLAQDVVHIKARVEAFIYENDEFDAGDTWV